MKVYLGYRIANVKTESTRCVGRVRISIKYKQQCEDWEQRVFRPCRNPLLGCGKIHSESERERCGDTHLACTASYTLHSAVSFWRYSLDLDSLAQLHRTHCLCYTLWSLFGKIHTLLGAQLEVHFVMSFVFFIYAGGELWGAGALHCRLVEVLVVPFCGDDEICVRL